MNGPGDFAFRSSKSLLPLDSALLIELQNPDIPLARSKGPREAGYHIAAVQGLANGVGLIIRLPPIGLLPLDSTVLIELQNPDIISTRPEGSCPAAHYIAAIRGLLNGVGGGRIRLVPPIGLLPLNSPVLYVFTASLVGASVRTADKQMGVSVPAIVGSIRRFRCRTLGEYGQHRRSLQWWRAIRLSVSHPLPR